MKLLNERRVVAHQKIANRIAKQSALIILKITLLIRKQNNLNCIVNYLVEAIRIWLEIDSYLAMQIRLFPSLHGSIVPLS